MHLESNPSKEEVDRRKMEELLVACVDKGQLTKGDFETGLGETLEFLDSIACDAPSAWGFATELLTIIIGKGMLTKEWCSSKIPDAENAEKVLGKIT